MVRPFELNAKKSRLIISLCVVVTLSGKVAGQTAITPAPTDSDVVVIEGTDPKDFTTVREVFPSGEEEVVLGNNGTFYEVDNRSVLILSFDSAKIAKARDPTDPETAPVKLSITADLISGNQIVRATLGAAPDPQGVAASPEQQLEASQAQLEQRIATTRRDASRPSVPPLVRRSTNITLDAAEEASSSLLTQPTTVNVDVVNSSTQLIFTGAAPLQNVSVDLGLMSASTYERLRIRVINTETNEYLEVNALPRPFGFRVAVTDSVLFVKRLGVSEDDRQNGINAINFSPSPGVTLGGNFLSRTSPFLKFLHPGVGINASFLGWGDSAFDPSTGEFIPGTGSSDIEIGLGVQATLFDNRVFVTYGWNLQAETSSTYLGIGVSFVNLVEEFGSILPD